jgi:RimJ/RimL family protein N-acetyltransferase
MLGPTLETNRLRLRPPCSDDFESWATMVADSVATRFLGGPQSRSAARRNMCMFTGAWIVRGFSNFSIIEKETGRWIGSVGRWQPEEWPGTEVGWALGGNCAQRRRGPSDDVRTLMTSTLDRSRPSRDELNPAEKVVPNCRFHTLRSDVTVEPGSRPVLTAQAT